MNPIQFRTKIRNAFANSWALVIGYVVIGVASRALGEIYDRRLMAAAIADEIESRDWGFEAETITEIMSEEDPLDDMVAFTDTQGTDWYKNADGDWVNL